MGAWQLANNKINRMQQYEQSFHQILAAILPHIKKKQFRPSLQPAIEKDITDAIVMIVGTDRGLCGKFNQSLAENAIDWIESQQFQSVEIWTLGSQISRELQRKNITISHQESIITGQFASFQQTYLSTQQWLKQYEVYHFNKFLILYNGLKKGGGYQFSVCNLIPYNFQKPTLKPKNIADIWPSPIVDTDPLGIYKQIVQYFIASNYYQTLLKSAAAEHATRFELMQEAKNNAEEIIEELGRVINAERKKKITLEMQELAVGAGLLDY